MLLFANFSIAQDTTLLNNQTVDGYKGIWFTLGQFSEYGDKYSGGLGTYTAKHIPLSIYSPEVNKTFFVYGGTTGPEDRYLLCMIGSYDHSNRKVTKPTVVYDKQGVDDPHDNPSLAIDAEGYLWVFVSGRGKSRPGFKYRSSEPYSTASFEQITEEEMTYPQPKYIPGKGFLHLFTKYTGIRELYFETSPDGLTWTEDQKLVGMKRPEDKNGGHYQISGQLGEKVVFFFNWHPDGNVDLRTNIYYLQTTDFGETWTTVAGEELDIPLSDVNSHSLVKEFYSEGKNVYIKDVNFDEQGNPIALYLAGSGHQPGPDNGAREWFIAHYKGSEWEHHKITESDQNYDTGSIFIDGDEWMVIGPSEDSPQQWGAGGEVMMWKSSDAGITWENAKQLTKKSELNHNYVRKVVNGKDPFLYFWADGNPDEISQSQLYFGNSKGKVWKLPYDMNKDEKRPKRVR
ncbi:putative BNR repeat neuraminidase [Algoriphagus chordae]|uniref:Putative BNR repeat neuraminidase n=2 Tax=Algoriphagus chordae TaxID=237019 RepID=A0A2W7RM76_9BACT|nr:putative BNR repeat neuraminidase [Algoriphagus chordae]